MINRENLIKIGRAGGNSLNREGIFGNSFSMHLQEGLHPRGGGGGVIIACIFLFTGDWGVL